MPRVHTQTARKDYPDEGIQKGQTYYVSALETAVEEAQATSYEGP